jgi:lipopolysaccharide assembly outer membrane protein LptD (OstA)
LTGQQEHQARARCCLLYCAGLLLVGAILSRAGAQSPTGDNPLRNSRGESRVQADRLVHRTIDGQAVTDLYGNVFIDRDTVSVRSDSARYWRERQVYEFMGRVRARQLEAVLTCRRAEYRRNLGEADFWGDVRAEQENSIGTSARGESRRAGQVLRLIGQARLVTPDYTVTADTILRLRDTRQGEASGEVKIVDTAAQTLITGDHALFSADGQSARVDRRPALTSRDLGQETFTSQARVMHFYRDDQRVVMVDSVRIQQGRTRATADTAQAFGRERLLLQGAPEVWVGGESRMTGREIEFLYRDGQLARILLRGQARMEDSTPDSLAALFTGLPNRDILEGEDITVEVEAGQVQRSVVIGAAHSLYVPTDLADEVAANDVHGDTIVIHFRNERVDRVFVNGDMTGTYTFARIADLESRRPAALAAAADSGLVPPLEAVGAPAADSLSGAAATPEPAAASAPPAAVDSTSAGYDFTAGAEVVEYSGGQVLFRLARRSIEIERNANLIYGTLNLTAQKVRFETGNRELYASGEPLLVDESQKIAGDQMGYDFAHKTGAVRHGVMTFEGNFYEGDEIKRYADGSLKILSGRMTACDLEEPHYHFWSDKMKIQLKDKVVAKPVVMKIGHVPIFGLPYYFKSLKEGRRSGILFPSFNFGWSSRTGRYIRDFGYYWATSPYTDFMFEGDYNERQDFNFRIRNQYVKRYDFRGGFAYSRLISLGDRPQRRQWQFQWRHDQEALFDEYKFSASVNMASESLERNDLTRNIERDIVSGQLNSTVFLSRSWSFMSSSLNVKRTEKVNAADDDPTTNLNIYSQTAPNLSLNFKRGALLSPLKRGRKGTFLGNMLRNTYFDHSYTFNNAREKNELTTVDRLSGNGKFSLSIQPPRVSVFNVSAGMNGSQDWSRTSTKGTAYGPVPEPLYGFPNLMDLSTTTQGFYDVDDTVEKTNPRLSFNASLGTVLYGLFPLRVGRLEAIRHTLRLQSSYSLRPALGSKQPRSESYNFSLSNRFDVKYLAQGARDSTAQFKKLDGVLDWSLSTSYNPNAPARRRWSTIGSKIDIKPGQSRNLDFEVSNTIDPNDWRILTTKITYALNLSGRLDTGGQAEADEAQRNLALDRLGAGADSTAAVEGIAPSDDFPQDPYADAFAGSQRPLRAEDGKDPTGGGRFLPWNASLSISYNRNNDRGTSSARSNFTVASAISRNWDFSYRASFDLDEGAVINQSWSLNRDLHCWRLEFTRTDYGRGDLQFGFRLYLKSIPSIKVTRGNEDELGGLGGLGQFGGGIF